MPKAAVVSHDKFLKASVAIQQVGMHKDDILYTPLPLYHSAAGIIGLGNVINTGIPTMLPKHSSLTTRGNFIKNVKKFAFISIFRCNTGIKKQIFSNSFLGRLCGKQSYCGAVHWRTMQISGGQAEGNHLF